MKYTNDMKYRHLLRRIQEEIGKPTYILDSSCELDDVIGNIVWIIEGNGISFDDMVEESMEIERLRS